MLDAYNADYQVDFANHSTLLETFPSDMQLLEQIPIHLAVTPGNKYLGDYIPKESILSYFNRLKVVHQHLQEKSEDASKSVNEIKSQNSISKLFSVKTEYF